jgi:hypothetical protein
MFTLGSTWSMANVGGGVTGSPTPTVSGPLVRGNGGGLFWYNGTGFVAMGGWFD